MPGPNSVFLLARPSRLDGRPDLEETQVDRIDPNSQPTVQTVDVRSRALAMWPGLDRRKLTRTCGDPRRVARLVERRTALSRESIIRILEGRSAELG